jgi:diacylglycerol kinase (ATP)
MTNAFIILNSAAGQCSAVAVRSAASRHFGRIDYQIHEASEGEVFGDIVRARLRTGVDLVVAAGGDGTVSAVVDGLAGGGVPLGIIPTGTANLVARELNIPLDIDAAAALIAGKPHPRMIDAMRIGGRVYVLIAGIGMSASVAARTTGKRKRRFGLIAYLGAALFNAMKFKSRPLEVEVDGVSTKYRALEVAVANCGILAKMLFPKGPDIRVDDGRLDVWVLGTKTVLDYPRYLFKIVSGRPATPRAQFMTAREHIAVRSSRPLPVQADGDVIGTTPIEIDVLRGALTVLVPEKPAVEPGLLLAREVFMAQYLTNFGKARWRGGSAAPDSISSGRLSIGHYIGIMQTPCRERT